MAEIENIHCPICTQPIPSSWQNGPPPALATDERRGDVPSESDEKFDGTFDLGDRKVQKYRQKADHDRACHRRVRLDALLSHISELLSGETSPTSTATTPSPLTGKIETKNLER